MKKVKNNQEELLVVVDKNDKVIDYLPRKLVHQQKLLHRTISISVFNSQGKILLQRRSMKMDNNPGKLANAAGGHVTKGLDYEKTAQKEIKEELGIKADLIFIKKMFINDPVHQTMTTLFKTYSNGPFKYQTEEIDEIKFHTKKELQRVKGQLSESGKIILKEQGLL